MNRSKRRRQPGKPTHSDVNASVIKRIAFALRQYQDGESDSIQLIADLSRETARLSTRGIDGE